ncbi:hypothetical protein GQ600_24191 [Phytophthora cactorum]|nr:hypothetical protein GQ600_24191 [Phytophthora cactorum]
MHFFSTRLIVHSPVNNITEGEVSPDKALSSSSKYIDAKAIAEKFVDRIALSRHYVSCCPTMASRFLRSSECWHRGGLHTTRGHTLPRAFTGLFCWSSEALADVFAEEWSSQVLGPSNGEQPSTKVEEQVGTDDQVDNALEADDHQGDVQADNQVNQEDFNGGKDAEAEKKSTERAEKDDEPNETKNAPKTQKPKKKSGVVAWKFADRPLVNGMTKAQRKRAKAKENHLLARALAAK